MFESCENKSCVDVNIYEDMILEEKEQFYVTLERTEGLDSRILLAPVNGLIEITSTDSMLCIAYILE